MSEERNDVGAVDSSPAGNGQGKVAVDEVESLQKALAAEKERAERYLANWQRAQADFSNFKRRAEQDKAEAIKFGTTSLMSGLIPILDDFERALRNIDRQRPDTTWLEGIELIYRKLMSALENQGLSRIDVTGKDFDPRFHQAVFYERGEEGKVIEEINRGYMLHDRLLRPSMVKVGKGSDDGG